MRITFDTNTLDKVSRPQRHPKDPRQSDYVKVRTAITEGRISGFFPEVAITLEGVQKADRVDVFGSSRLVMEPIRTFDSADGISHVAIKSTLIQDRKPLHEENEARMYAALALGMRALRGPARVAWVQVNDPNRLFFLDQDDDPLMPPRVEIATKVASAVEERGLGGRIVRSIGEELSTRAGANEPWFQGIRRARDEHERGRVKRAIAEWADADSIASHIGYGNDFFCTGDFGRSAGAASIFDATNRAWLAKLYGVKFVTLSELVRELDL